jgi:glycosyltransferase involved in cell wall biosynthesis
MRLLVMMATHSPWSQSVATSLAVLGHEVHVVDVEKGPRGGVASPTIAGVRDDYIRFQGSVAGVHTLTSPVGGPLRHLWAAPQLRRLFYRLQADMVLTLYGGGFGLITYLSGVRPYCIYVVGSDVLLASTLAREVNQWTFRAAARVFANGRYLSERTRVQAPNARVTELLLGVDPYQFTQADLSRRPIQIICTRGFDAVHNSGSIVRALARLPVGLPEYRMVFTSAGGRLPQVRALADRLLPPAVRCLVEFSRGGSYATLLQDLSNSHIFVSMSRSDGTPTSLLEALGTGLYPVLSDIPQNREWIDHSVGNGRLVPLDDDDALAGALADCIAQVDRLAAYSEGNRRMVFDRADARKTRATLSVALEEALAVHRRWRG